eukprot:1774039-Rhodomonas_salina.2
MSSCGRLERSMETALGTASPLSPRAATALCDVRYCALGYASAPALPSYAPATPRPLVTRRGLLPGEAKSDRRAARDPAHQACRSRSALPFMETVLPFTLMEAVLLFMEAVLLFMEAVLLSMEAVLLCMEAVLLSMEAVLPCVTCATSFMRAAPVSMKSAVRLTEAVLACWSDVYWGISLTEISLKVMLTCVRGRQAAGSTPCCA